jgi:tetratricopeptide (TPR) repeat protein
MLQLEISNFRIFDNLAFVADRPLSVIVGENESGKSSLLQALKFAFTGEAYGHKGKDAAQHLVRYGENRMAVRVQLNDFEVSRTGAGGTALKEIADRLRITPDLLPLLFDAEMCGDGGSKHLKAFLNLVGADSFRPGLVFANDQEISRCIGAATSAGCQTTKKIVQYCEGMRAASREPSRPAIPPVSEPSPTSIDQQKTLVEAARQARDNTKAELALVTQQGRGLAQIAAYVAEMAAYETALTRSQATDSLGNRRRSLEVVANLDLVAMQRIASCLQSAEFTAAAQQLSAVISNQVAAAVSAAAETLRVNPPPPSKPTLPVMGEQAKVYYQEGMKADDVQIRAQAAFEKERDLTTKLQIADHYLMQQNQLLEGIQRAAGAWQAYRQQMPAYEKALTDSKENWARWDRAAKGIQMAEADYLSKAADAFAATITEFTADILSGRQVRIDTDAEIWVGPTRILDCSKSTRWRAEVAIMTAIAVSLNSPILLIDGADILDYKNRQAMVQFLLSKVAPRFQHVLLATTAAKSLDEESRLPAALTSVNKYIIRNGALSLHPTQAPA